VRRHCNTFASAVEDIARITTTLLAALETSASPKDRLIEADEARMRSLQRFGT
jgi:hypothetical protein